MKDLVLSGQQLGTTQCRHGPDVVYTKGRPTGMVVSQSPTGRQSGFGNGRGYCPFEAPLPREHLFPAGSCAVFLECQYQSKAVVAACAYGQRAY